MEEQFVLRVPPSVAEQLNRLLSETSSSTVEQSLDLSFSEDGRSGTFSIGDEHFPASLLDLPCILESYKTYDDSVLIKTADIGQMIMVREEDDPVPDSVEYRHGVTPPMRDARRRRFRREPDLNPEVIKRVENDLWNIMNSGNILLLFSFSLLIYFIYGIHSDLVLKLGVSTDPNPDQTEDRISKMYGAKTGPKISVRSGPVYVWTEITTFIKNM